MSHHLDSPLAREDPRLDISDVYVFRGTSGTVLMMNVNPLSGPGGFHPEARYEFRIDEDGDAVEDRTYYVTFGEPDVSGRQSFELRRLDGVDARHRKADGRVLASGHTGETVESEGLRIWADKAADPFYINGSVVASVKEAVASGKPFNLIDVDYAAAANLFAKTNVCSIVVEISDDEFDVPKIGFWCTTALATDSGGWRQINRCANPLVNTIFNPDDSQRASDYNINPPSEDVALYGPLVTELVTRVVAAADASDDPAAHALRVVDIIFPDILRYEIGTPAEFGFATRNGRGLRECVAEVMFSLVLNRAVPLGISGRTAGAPSSNFPYLAPAV